MGRMKELFIELNREDEDKQLYYPDTPSDLTCPNCNSNNVESFTRHYYDCMNCGYHLVLVDNGLKIN